MSDLQGYSEYDGKGVMPNTVYPKGTDALTNGDKLRLISITGQETDSRAPVDEFFWIGGQRPDKNAIAAEKRAYRQEQQRLKKEAREQYRESPI